jgi:cell division protein FtsI/penicillin-binding protein 2
MLLRGRLTIAACVVLLGWLVAALLSLSGEDDHAAAADVAQGPPEALVAPEPLPPVPAPPAAAAAAPVDTSRLLSPRGRLDAALLAAPSAREEFRELRVVDGALESTPIGADEIRLRYTLHPELSEAVWKALERGRFEMAHVVVMDPRSGAVLAYASTDPRRFPPDKTYPAASLVKVITAAATLDRAPQAAHETCYFLGSPWRLTKSRLESPKRGNQADMRKALATSNNQCFARWAVSRVGPNAMLGAIDRFGMLTAPALGLPGGRVEPPDDEFALGELGSGLDGLSITPLHAAQLAATLAEGRLVKPRWVAEAWNAQGQRVALPEGAGSRQVLTPELAGQLRSWLVDTTVRGTARRAFRARGGRPLLPGIPVSGKTGSLNGTDPKGHYEWFIGVAPADDPQLAIATVAVQGPRWWWSASQLAAEVLRAAFCPRGRCDRAALERLYEPGDSEPPPAPRLAAPATAG